MNVPLLIAGGLALFAAAVHGLAGEVLVVRPLPTEELPGTRFGGPRATKAMIRASWHIATFAFLTVGAALVLTGSVLGGEVGRAVSVVAAVASSGFAVVTLAAALALGPHALRRHLGPLALTAVAAFAWWGVLLS